MSENNPFPGESNTGHFWDEDLRELTNDPPTWWRIGFHASWLIVIGYTLWYPSWPLINSHFEGIGGWTAIGEYKADMKEVETIRAPYEEKIASMPAADILKDQDLSNYVQRSAKVLFGDKCAACHGSGGAGNPGFPVLADDDWLYGGGIDKLVESITNGRMGMMPAQSATLSTQEISDVAKHVVALSSGGEYEAGKAVFTGKGACFACHGMDAKGNQMLGSANLADGIWRFAPGGEESAVHTITHGVNVPSNDMSRNAVMPKFGDKLSESDIKKLAVYVYNLGGGQ